MGKNATHAENIVIANSFLPNGVGFLIVNGDDSETVDSSLMPTHTTSLHSTLSLRQGEFYWYHSGVAQ
jgi:hypothetical protein